MANFYVANALTSRHEGGWVNNPNDTGKETIFGVSRRNWPHWSGWATVDALKSKPGFPGTANAHAGLKDAATQLYKQSYWDALRLDGIANQPLANAVYDFGVNAGTARSAIMLQQAYNLLSAREIEADGKIGPATLAAINALKNQSLLLKVFAILRGAFYLDIARRSASQKIFVPSWLSRISIA